MKTSGRDRSRSRVRGRDPGRNIHRGYGKWRHSQIMSSSSPSPLRHGGGRHRHRYSKESKKKLKHRSTTSSSSGSGSRDRIRRGRSRERHRGQDRRRRREKSRSKSRTRHHGRGCGKHEGQCQGQLEKFEKLKCIPSVSITHTFSAATAQTQATPTAPLNLVQQMQQRKLLFSRLPTENGAPGQVTSSSSETSPWNVSAFVGDIDGHISTKFKRLMGIKNKDANPPQAPNSTSSLPSTSASTSMANTNNEAMFADLERQYEVARMTTHSQRGLGFGFGSSSKSCFSFR